MSSIDVVGKKIASKGWANVLRPADEHVKFVPTGVLSIDAALLGGIPRGHIGQIIGYYSAGKTTTSFIITAAFQRAFPDKYVVYLDVEGTLDTTWAEVYGVDLERLLIVRPEDGEQAVDIADEYMRSPDVVLVVLDSVAAMISNKILEKEAGETIPGVQARLMSNLCAKATNAISKGKNSGTHIPTLLVLNYWRSKIVMMGDNRVIPGGNHLSQASSWILNLKNSEKKGQDSVTKDVVALMNEHSFEVMKNKLGNSVKQGIFHITRTDSHRKGAGFVDQGETVWTFARKLGLITGGGGKFSVAGIGLTGKKSEIISFFEDNPDIFEPVYHEMLCRHRGRYQKRMDDWRDGLFVSIEFERGVADDSSGLDEEEG